VGPVRTEATNSTTLVVTSHVGEAAHCDRLCCCATQSSPTDKRPAWLAMTDAADLTTAFLACHHTEVLAMNHD